MAFGVPKRIEVKYDDKTVQDMISLLKASPFPDKAPIDVDTPWKLGIDYDYLKNLKILFETQWSWQSLERKIAQFDNYLVHYEHENDSLDLHYVHAKSPRSDAIPLILLHGWPSTFFDFHKVIEPLTNPGSPDLPAFHVVVPSLPGYFLSTLPRREGWTFIDIARVFKGLMTSVLGYEKYVGQGGDFGSMILRIMGNIYPQHVSLMHYTQFYIASVSEADPTTLANDSRYSESEKASLKRWCELRDTAFGHAILHRTKPFTIGVAIASSPLAVLAYIGEKVYGWSDPKLIDPHDILNTVALYYLSGTLPTSVMMYYQSAKQLHALSLPPSEGHFPLKNKFGFSAFPHELGLAPKVEIAAYGPLVYYKEHSSGGHYPALDNPTVLVGDLREFFGQHWSRA